MPGIVGDDISGETDDAVAVEEGLNLFERFATADC